MQQSKTKWEINKELIAHCSKLLALNSKKINGYTIVESVLLNKSSAVKVNLLDKEKFNLELPEEGLNDKDLIKLAETLRSHLGSSQKKFYSKLDELKESDSKVALSSKGQKLIYQIAFNLDKIPELKSEIIKIGQLLEKEEDIFDHYGF